MIKIMLVDNYMLMRRVVREVIEKEEDLEVIAEANNGPEAQAQALQAQPDIILMDLDMPDCDAFELEEHLLTCSPSSRVVIFTASNQGQHVILALQKGAIGYITKDIEPDALIHALRCAAQNDLYIPAALAIHVLSFLRIRALPDVYVRHSTLRGSGHESHHYLEPVLTGRFRRPIMTRGSSAIAYRIAVPAARPQLPPPTAAVVDEEPGQAETAPPSVRYRPLTEREREILDLMRHGRKNKEIAGELCIAESTVHKHVQNIFEKLHARNRAEAIFLTGLDAFVEPTVPLESDQAVPSSDQELPEASEEEAHPDTVQKDHDPLLLQ